MYAMLNMAETTPQKRKYIRVEQCYQNEKKSFNIGEQIYKRYLEIQTSTLLQRKPHMAAQPGCFLF